MFHSFFDQIHDTVEIGSCVGIFKQEWQQTNVGDWLFPSTCDGLSFQQTEYNALGLFFLS